MVEKVSNQKAPIEKPFFLGGADVQARLRGVAGLTDLDRRRIKAEVISLEAVLEEEGHEDEDIDRILEERLSQPNIPVQNVIGFAEPTLAIGSGHKADRFWNRYREVYILISRGKHIPEAEEDLWDSKEQFDKSVKTALDAHLKGRSADERIAYEQTAATAWRYRRFWKNTAFWPLTDHKRRLDDLVLWLHDTYTWKERRKSKGAFKRAEIGRRKETRDNRGALKEARAEDKAARKPLFERIKPKPAEPAPTEPSRQPEAPRRPASPEPRRLPAPEAPTSNGGLSEEDRLRLIEEAERLSRGE